VVVFAAGFQPQCTTAKLDLSLQAGSNRASFRLQFHAWGDAPATSLQRAAATIPDSCWKHTNA